MTTTYIRHIDGAADTIIRKLGYNVKFNMLDEGIYESVTLREPRFNNFLRDFDTAVEALDWAIDRKLGDRYDEYNDLMAEIEKDYPELYEHL